ncbi:MAG: 23S rRNA (pseudouridine(1915)-N(3))-methyltransferase RlmH [Parasporobacterium sp.]|nr:23S rRNA (pseudouridine(1915)-N(3))-methyltransferase RlmH [Parasporobacterium sp.]
MKITIICVGKIKESFFRDAISEYQKRLSKFCNLSIIEVADEKTPDNASPATEDLIRKKEAERIIKHLKTGTYLIGLEIDGNMLDSKELASHIDNLSLKGKSDISFVIGGSLGLDKSITSLCDFHLSFSKMTFPHQLMRVILLEQIYRAFKILANEPYHK